jgi:hypothetical protein
MRVTSVIILLNSGRQNIFIVLYRELRDDSNILLTAVELYEAWDKPEVAEKWWAKLPKPEAVIERRCTFFNSKKAPPRLRDILLPFCHHNH